MNTAESDKKRLLSSKFAEKMLHRFSGVFTDDFAREHGRQRRKSRRSDTRLDLIAWGKEFLPDHFIKPPSEMHRWLAKMADNMEKHRGMKINILGPRGGAKSTLGTLAFPLRAALEGREPYIWIVSDTKNQAQAHLENIVAELTDNLRLADEYSEAIGTGIRRRGQGVVLKNGAVIEAYGTGQRLRGRRRRTHRPTLIVCDDLENDEMARSPTQREQSQEWFHAMLLKAGTTETNILHLATALHREALAMRLCKTPGWSSKVFQAVVRWPERMSLWHEWETIYSNPSDPHYGENADRFYDKHRAAMESGAIVLWPEVENLYALMKMRVESGRTSFEREKQNSPIAPTECEWPESYFSETIWFDDWPKEFAVRAMALDPSKGSDARRGDYSALAMIGVDRRGIITSRPTLLDARRRRSWPRGPNDSCNSNRTFSASRRINSKICWRVEFEAEFRRRGILEARPVAVSNQTNKLVRIRRLGPFLASGRLRFKNNSPGTAMLVQQMRDFPIGDHDDGPDAFELAIRLAGQWLHGRRISDGLGNRLIVE